MNAGLLGVIAAATLALVLPTTASGQAFEPNGTVVDASGPLLGGQDYTASVETPNDIDFYYFNTSSGQRQLDISVTGLTAPCNSIMSILQSDGSQIVDPSTNVAAPRANIQRSPTTGPITDHILYSVPGNSQFVLMVGDGSDPPLCDYRFRIDPPSAVTTEPPGVTVLLRGSGEPDNVQTLSLNGQSVAATSGSQRVALGNLPADARIGIDVANGTGTFGWDFSITNQPARQIFTLASERQSGGIFSSPLVGTVRHLVVNPAGAILESCGERGASVSCIPPPPPPPPPLIDADKDGAPAGTDCNDSNAAVFPDAREVPDNPVDENCDGLAFRRARELATIGASRKARRYVGRVRSSSPFCVGGRTVKLRRVGSGSKAFGSASTSSSGRYEIRRANRLRGRLYVVATARANANVVCRFSKSPTFRG